MVCSGGRCLWTNHKVCSVGIKVESTLTLVPFGGLLANSNVSTNPNRPLKDWHFGWLGVMAVVVAVRLDCASYPVESSSICAPLMMVQSSGPRASCPKSRVPKLVPKNLEIVEMDVSSP